MDKPRPLESRTALGKQNGWRKAKPQPVATVTKPPLVWEPAALDNLFVDKPRPLESRTSLRKQNGFRRAKPQPVATLNPHRNARTPKEASNAVCCFHVGAKLPKSRLLLSLWGRAPKSRLLLSFGGRTSSTSGLTTGKALERFPECSFYPVPSESMVSMHTPQSLCTASASESSLSWQRLGIAT